jgi:hypothetical protein
MSKRPLSSQVHSRQAVSGNGLLDRRFFPKQGIAMFGLVALPPCPRRPRKRPIAPMSPWDAVPGAGMVATESGQVRAGDALINRNLARR